MSQAELWSCKWCKKNCLHWASVHWGFVTETCSATHSHYQLASGFISDHSLKWFRDDVPNWPSDDFLCPNGAVREEIMITGSPGWNCKGEQPSLLTSEGKLQSTFTSYKVQRYMEALLFSHCSVRIFYLKTPSCKKAEVGKEMNFWFCNKVLRDLSWLLLHTDTCRSCLHHPTSRQSWKETGSRRCKMWLQ